MLERLAFGDFPPKHHLALRHDGKLRYESCLTRQGFEGPYTISYHVDRPQSLRADEQAVEMPWPTASSTGGGLLRRHYRTQALISPANAEPGAARAPILGNADLVISAMRFEQPDTTYHINARHDELWFVLEGQGTLVTPLGSLSYQAFDYVLIPRGLLFRVDVDSGRRQHYLSMRFAEGVDIPRRFQNPSGQLRMDAPYCHRDFRRPSFNGPVDEGIRELWVSTGPARRRFLYDHSPLDTVGWDGCVYPWAFPIERFQPRVSSVHLPPTWHGTFESPGALVCSFVPRPLEFHPEAVVCPYPHLSAEIDEVLFYVAGEFSSRKGVERGSLTWHPAGFPHGPHPGRYEAGAPTGTEASPSWRVTTEMAVMLDCHKPLSAMPVAEDIEDPAYDASFS